MGYQRVWTSSQRGLNTMKKILLSSVALLGLSVAAMAADLPSRCGSGPMIAAGSGLHLDGLLRRRERRLRLELGQQQLTSTRLSATAAAAGDDGGFVGGAPDRLQLPDRLVRPRCRDATCSTPISATRLGYYVGYYAVRNGSDNDYFGTARVRAGVAFDRAWSTPRVVWPMATSATTTMPAWAP